MSKYKIWEFIPYSEEKNLGIAYAECVALVPSDDDWIILSDCDSLYLTPSHIHMVRRAIDMRPNTGLFICKTNRVKNKRQIHDLSLFDDMDIRKHRKIALELAKQPLTFTEINNDIGGYFMCLKKSTAIEIGFKLNKILGVDTKTGRRVRRLGKKILMINNLYKYHYYRYCENIEDTSHLK